MAEFCRPSTVLALNCYTVRSTKT